MLSRRLFMETSRMKYPDGVPEENWLPINREDIGIGPIMRLYEPDLERFANWSAPTAETL